MDSRGVGASLFVMANLCVGCMDFAENVARLQGKPGVKESAGAPPSVPAGQAVRVDSPGIASQDGRGTGSPAGSESVPAARPVVAGSDVATPVADPAGAVPVPVVAPQPPVVLPPPPVVAASDPVGPVIELSAGTALPQTLPQGTVMTFTVDYRFAQGGPEPGGRSVWVVEGGGKVERAEIPRLDLQGQLPAFFSRILTPNDGPFRCWIEEWPHAATTGRPLPGRRISNIAPLQ